MEGIIKRIERLVKQVFPNAMKSINFKVVISALSANKTIKIDRDFRGGGVFVIFINQKYCTKASDETLKKLLKKKITEAINMKIDENITSEFKVGDKVKLTNKACSCSFCKELRKTPGIVVEVPSSNKTDSILVKKIDEEVWINRKYLEKVIEIESIEKSIFKTPRFKARIEDWNGTIVMQILEQMKLPIQFKFKASNNLTVISFIRPDINEQVIYLRGSDTKKDFNIITTNNPSITIKEIKQAITEAFESLEPKNEPKNSDNIFIIN